MADMLLDASLFRAYLGGDRSARRVVDRVLEGSETAAVSSVTVFELWRDPDLDRRTEMALTALIGFVEVAPLSADAAKRAGLLLAARDNGNGASVGNHALVAAVAWSEESRSAPSTPAPTRTSASNSSSTDSYCARRRSTAFSGRLLSLSLYVLVGW